MSTRTDDGTTEGGPVVIDLEDGAALMYDPENPRAWIRSDAPSEIEASV